MKPEAHESPPHHELAANCPRCDHWRVLPLVELVAQGHESRRLPIAVRCQVCGLVGQLQVQLPVPARRPDGLVGSLT